MDDVADLRAGLIWGGVCTLAGAGLAAVWAPDLPSGAASPLGQLPLVAGPTIGVLLANRRALSLAREPAGVTAGTSIGSWPEAVLLGLLVLFVASLTAGDVVGGVVGGVWIGLVVAVFVRQQARGRAPGAEPLSTRERQAALRRPTPGVMPVGVLSALAYAALAWSDGHPEDAVRGALMLLLVGGLVTLGGTIVETAPESAEALAGTVAALIGAVSISMLWTAGVRTDTDDPPLFAMLIGTALTVVGFGAIVHAARRQR